METPLGALPSSLSIRSMLATGFQYANTTVVVGSSAQVVGSTSCAAGTVVLAVGMGGVGGVGGAARNERRDTHFHSLFLSLAQEDTGADINLHYASNTSDLSSKLSLLSASPGGSGPVSSDYPPVLSLLANCTLTANLAVNYVIRRDMLLSGPVGPKVCVSVYVCVCMCVCARV